MAIIDTVLQLAKEKGISQAFICNKLGLSRNYLSEVKKGKTKISDDRIATIAVILNTTPEYLKGETDQKEKPAGESTDGQDAEFYDLIKKLSPEQRELVKAQIKGILSNY